MSVKKMRKRKRNRARKKIFKIIIFLCTISAISGIKKYEAIPPDPIEYENEVESNRDDPLNNDTSNDTSSNTSNAKKDDWKLILVNASNRIPDDYSISLMTLKNNFQIDERIYPDLQEMFDAARREGVYPLIGSAYRTTGQQQKLLTDKINAYIAEDYSEKEANELAKKWVSAPGTSEHQIGLALDINAEKDKCTNEEVYAWLNTNSYKYGFIMRYPADKTEITGVNYEPWHYRYVGKEAAKEIYERGICLEAYLDS